MSVIYNSAAIIPGPLVSFNDEPIVDGAQRRIGNTYRLTITGTLVSFKGSPNAGSLSGAGWGGPLGVFWTDSGYPPDETVQLNHSLFAIEAKQQALRTLFATEGQWLEFDSPDGSAPLKCQIKNVSVTFAEGIWVFECPYTITCETDALYLNGEIYQGLLFPENIQSASENWEIDPNEVVKTFAVTHTVSAVGKKTYDVTGNELQPAWQTARDFVNLRLVLGWNGGSAFSTIPGQQIFLQSSLGSGVINFADYNPYNFARKETVDELAGSYAVTENWILAATSGSETYNISVNRISNEQYTNVEATINGTIKGFYTSLFDYDTRVAAANYVWSQLEGEPLYNRVQSYIGINGVTLNMQPQTAQVDYNYNEGSLSYTYKFSNSLYNQDAFESYVISKKRNDQDYLSTYSIQGTIRGRRYDGDSNNAIAYQRALTLWNAINVPPTLYNRVIESQYFPEAATVGLQQLPSNVDVNCNEADGSISYTYEFNNRVNDGGENSNVTEQYTVSRGFDRNQGFTSYTVAGSVKGLNVLDIPNPKQYNFSAATGYYYTFTKPNLYSRVSSYYNVTLPDVNPYVIEETFNENVAEVTYTSTFYNYPLPIISGALSEQISISEENWLQDVQLTADIPIPGRAKGPVMQPLNTTTPKYLTLNIETVMPPVNATSLSEGFAAKPDYRQYIGQLSTNGYYVEGHSDNWDWKNGRYSTNIKWKYE